MDPNDLKPSDHAEQIAIFRATILGPVMLRDLAHGQLANELRALSEARYRPPGADSTRTYQVPTLERWLYAYRARGLAGLRPEPRSDRGFAQELSEELRELLLDIRREHPSASVSLILDTLIEEGYFEKTKVSEPTVRRLYAAAGLPRHAKRGEGGTKTRLRWQACHPGALWHGDVCHVTTCKLRGKPTPIRIHGMLDDASRYIVALEAHTTEKEVDMLGMLVDALRQPLEEFLRAGVDPMQVLQDHDDGPPRALAEDDGAEDLVRAVPKPGALSAQQEFRRHREAQEVMEHEGRLLALEPERDEPRGDSPPHVVRRELLGELEISPIQLDERAVCHRATVGRAGRLELQVLACVQASQELVEQA